ncbi:hypothetical protein ACIGXI_36965 [Kitasatospora aureofaciens]|uniref:hypothetical protein n=1 Tax=Kitasatospora aureofaciens TaxID=1894 RepID=UPI0037CB846E
MSLLRSKIALSAATLGLAAGSLALAVPANADTIQGYSNFPCYNRICLSYHANGIGSWWTSDATEWTDLAGEKFGVGMQGSTAYQGYGADVKNAAAWVANSGAEDLYVYVNSKAYNWGAYDVVKSTYAGNLGVTYNNEASYSIYNHG